MHCRLTIAASKKTSGPMRRMANSLKHPSAHRMPSFRASPTFRFKGLAIRPMVRRPTRQCDRRHRRFHRSKVRLALRTRNSSPECRRKIESSAVLKASRGASLKPCRKARLRPRVWKDPIAKCATSSRGRSRLLSNALNRSRPLRPSRPFRSRACKRRASSRSTSRRIGGYPDHRQARRDRSNGAPVARVRAAPIRNAERPNALAHNH